MFWRELTGPRAPVTVLVVPWPNSCMRMFQSAFAIGWESRLQLPRVQHRRHRYFSTACLEHVGIMVRDLDQSTRDFKRLGFKVGPGGHFPILCRDGHYANGALW